MSNFPIYHHAMGQTDLITGLLVVAAAALVIGVACLITRVYADAAMPKKTRRSE
jgi:hypothetical protein